eukprot:38297-Pyramimonas_sp.AAC.1
MPMLPTAAPAGENRSVNSADAVSMGSEPPESIDLTGTDAVANTPLAVATVAGSVADATNALDTSKALVADSIADAPQAMTKDDEIKYVAGLIKSEGEPLACAIRA